MKIKTQPSDNQKMAVNFLRSRPAGLVCFATGSGKSYIGILSSIVNLLDKSVDKVIIVATKSSSIEFEADFKTHTTVVPKAIFDEETFLEFMTGPSQIGMVQYQHLSRVKASTLVKYLIKFHVGFVFDEVHRLANPKSALTHFYRTMVRAYATRVYGLTATPVMSDVENLYYVVDFLSPGYLGDFYSFRGDYCLTKKKPIYRNGRKTYIVEVVGYKNIDKLKEKLAGIMVTYFPDMQVEFVKEEGELTDQALYLKAAKGVFDSENEKMFAHRLIDLQKVVNEDIGKKNAFLKALKEVIHEGTLVFCAYYTTRDVVVDLLKSLRIPYMEITGEKEVDERLDAKRWFTEDPRNKVLVITLAGGQSLNLQATPNIILYDCPFGLGFFSQIVGRVCREYSAHKVFKIIFISLRDTIDDYKFALLALNRDLILQLFGNKLLPEKVDLKMSAYIKKRLKDYLLWRTRKTK